MLDDVDVVYRPFTTVESHLLRRFHDGARRLGGMKFFEEVPAKVTISFDRDVGLDSQMAEPDDEALRAALTQFRQLYKPNEPHSFHQAIALLKRSVHEKDGPRRDEAIAALDEFNEAKRVAMSGAGAEIVFKDATTGEQRKMTSERIIEAYLHGQYLHSGNAKCDIARDLDNIPGLSRFTFYTVMLALRNLYWCAANAVDRVLAVPALLDAD